MVQFERGSGVLLHPSSLPGSQGIGCLGAEARAFLDWLEDSGQSYWQICPMVPTGYGDSPYQGLSAFAGNPNLIDLEFLVQANLLEPSDLKELEKLPSDRVNFSRLVPLKKVCLKKAWTQFRQYGQTHPFWREFEDFRHENSTWLDDFSLFMVIKECQDERSWEKWDRLLRFRNPDAVDTVRKRSKTEIGYHDFVQFIFDRQWKALKSEAGRRGIRIIGDLPIFISYDSSDCWAHPDLFLLDAHRRPVRVAGVPPDYFSSTGQLWGNPLYNWAAMKENNYHWWIEVFKDKLDKYDILRVDHFRGFSAYWSVPYGETTAVNGEWVPAPGKRLFRQLKAALGDVPVIAEDLGVITDDVVELIEYCGFPRMKVLQFAFDSAEENNYLPHTYNRNCIVYTGTHDNDTVVGWYKSASEADKRAAQDYLNLPENTTPETVAGAMIRAAVSSVANLAIIPLQDILKLGSEARFNRPGTLSSVNWSWRVDKALLSEDTAKSLRKLSTIYGRLPTKRTRETP